MKYYFLNIRLMVFISAWIVLSGCGSSSDSGSVSPPISNPSPVAPPVTPSPAPTNTTPPVVDSIPQGGELIISSNTSQSLNIVGGAVDSNNTIDVSHPEFDSAIEISIANPSGAFWQSQVLFPNTQAVAKDDVLLIRLFFRTTQTLYESGNGFFTVFMEGPAPSYTKYVEREISSDSEWVEYLIPLQAGLDFDAGGFPLRFGVGAGDRAQTIQVAKVEVYNYKQSLTLDELPESELTYAGRESDASWREAAAQRIEQFRKADFTIEVRNAANQPVSNADVEVKFVKHAYHFGSVIASGILMGSSPDSETYRQTLKKFFNQSGTENDLKWPAWIGEWGQDFNQAQTIEALTWLKDNDFYTRGHVLVWPSKRNLPSAIQHFLPEDPANADSAVLNSVSAHIDDITSKTEALLDEWDVLNEPFDNHYLMDAFGDEVMLDWFNRARENLPNHKLYINDYSILSGGGKNIVHQQHYQDTIQYLVDNNAPIDGIGLQSHFGEVPTDIDTVYALVERFHQAFPNAAIRATEFDINTRDQALQADYTRDFLTIMFSHPATVGVQVWGFWEGRGWLPNASMFTLDWTEKPNAIAWYNLIYRDWWNDFSGKTSNQGDYSSRGFLGDYQVTVSVDGVTRVSNFVVSKDSNNRLTVIIN